MRAGVGFRLAYMGLCNFGGESLGVYVFIVSLSMLIVPIFGWLIFREKPKRIFWFSLPIALAGLALLSLSGGWHSSPGQLWFLINACLLALHFNVNSRLSKSVPVLALTTIQLGVLRLRRYLCLFIVRDPASVCLG